jgi:hypothetical protein
MKISSVSMTLGALLILYMFFIINCINDHWSYANKYVIYVGLGVILVSLVSSIFEDRSRGIKK